MIPAAKPGENFQQPVGWFLTRDAKNSPDEWWRYPPAAASILRVTTFISFDNDYH